MKTILEEVGNVAGVTGAFLYHPRKGVVANTLPPLFKEENLAEIGNLLIRIYMAGRKNFSDMTEATLYYQESIVTARAVGNGICLAVFSDPSCKTNLLSMAINMAGREIRRRQVVETETSPAPPAASPTATVTVESLLDDPELAAPLEAMRSQLSKIVGPMASIIFEDSLDAWIAAGEPTAETLPTLVDILNREIDDPEKCDRYMALIRPHLPVPP